MVKAVKTAKKAKKATTALKAVTKTPKPTIVTKKITKVATAGNKTIKTTGIVKADLKKISVKTKPVIKTGTVYDKIQATQGNYPNTSLPKSFNIDVQGQKLWVHPNATKHMNEYLTRDNQNIGTFTSSVNSQMMLSEFDAALNEAISQNGIQTGKLITGGGWEFIIAKPRSPELNFVVKHARFVPKNT